MLKREWDAKINGKLPHLFIPDKTAALVPEFVVEDLSLAELQLRFSDIYIIIVKRCVFQCQPTALLRASGSAQGGKMALSVVYFRITHRLGRPHYVWEEYLL